MVLMCGVINCSKKSGKSGKSFFRLPSELIKQKASEEKRAISSLRREKWLNAIKRDDLTETKKKYLRICEDHFISRKPADLWDKDNPDWVPSLNLGYHKRDTCASDLARFNRVQKRIADSKNPTNKRKRISHTGECAVIVNDVFKTDADGKLQFMGYLPGKEPRGQTRRKTFKDFIMSREASLAHAKLRETNEKLAVLHKRRLSLLRGKSKFSNLSDSPVMYPPYESHFINYKGESSSNSSKKSSFEANVTSEDPSNDSEVDDPPVEEILSSDNESSNRSENLSSEESWRELPLNSNKSSNSSLHQPPEENSSSDESSVDSVSYKNVSSKNNKSDTISALNESNSSSDENSTNLVTFISKLSSPISSVSSPKKSENVTENGSHYELLTSLDNNPRGKKSQISLIKSAVSSSNTKLLKFKDSHLARLAKNKNEENSDALLSNSFRREIANLREKLHHMQRSTKYWKQKNANLKSLLDQQDVEQDD